MEHENKETIREVTFGRVGELVRGRSNMANTLIVVGAMICGLIREGGLS